MRWTKRAWVATEALLAFILFSMMIGFYLPSLLAIYSQMRSYHKTNQTWRYFSLLVTNHQAGQDDILKRLLDESDQVIGHKVIDFDCHGQACWIEYEGGLVYHVQEEGNAGFHPDGVPLESISSRLTVAGSDSQPAVLSDGQSADSNPS